MDLMKMLRIVFLLFALCVFFSACQIPQHSRIKDEPFVIDNTHRLAKPVVDPKPGSIWKGVSTTNTFFGDQRARFVGDIITVKIVEVSQASEKATTGTKRASDINTGIPHLLGLETNKIPSSIDLSKMISASTKNDFSGDGETTRTGSLSATITARIVDVMPSGNLAIEGKREINVNSERKEILLQGIIRPRDIAYDNTILSTQVADAKVIYTGIGVIGEKQEPGWLARWMDRFWPF
ncbi:MAG: flagellar biosynthesis protein FlgH [Syntrophus sp. (in: bacteria)]|nr:flagellar biosynthesis protein FlgH [Syntrophus sp. (in: bacteria)]